jgi:pyrimidine operon attenuation protein / uracil phosphoribosyltransferase
MESVQNRTAVLNRETIQRKIRRMALQIAEQNSEQSELVIAGVNGNGEVVARLLSQYLQELTSFRLNLVKIILNKKDPLSVEFSPAVDVSGKVVILVDDVANTGRTMLYALKPLLSVHPQKIQTLVLVERSHKLFPIQTDYAGLSIATTLQEHITVETEGEEITGAWLH